MGAHILIRKRFSDEPSAFRAGSYALVCVIKGVLRKKNIKGSPKCIARNGGFMPKLSFIYLITASRGQFWGWCVERLQKSLNLEADPTLYTWATP